MDKPQNKDLNSNLFSLNKNQIKEEKKRKQEEELRKALKDLKEASEPFRKHPIATILSILWFFLFCYSIIYLWNEDMIIIVLDILFWIFVLYMGLDIAEINDTSTIDYSRYKEPTEINLNITIEIKERKDTLQKLIAKD
ncbi:hypothetical protein SAMN02910357_00056 [Succinivibrio dextrinosolvens]|nr:hypothetical protein SAMN02910357_00056 [Succinivibrio dextrinosolvens]